MNYQDGKFQIFFKDEKGEKFYLCIDRDNKESIIEE